MKKILIFFLFVPIMSFSQIDSLRINSSGFEENIVKVELLKSNEIYKKMKHWVQKYYKNPNVVLKSDIPNEYLRIDGVSNFSFKWMGTQTYDYSYSLSLAIKDGKYKVDFDPVMMYDKSLPDFFFDKKGNRKKQSVNMEMCNSFINDINKIHFDLYQFLTSKQSEW